MSVEFCLHGQSMVQQHNIIISRGVCVELYAIVVTIIENVSLRVSQRSLVA